MHPVYIESTLLQFLLMQNFLVLNMFIKLFYFIRIFMLYSFIICISFVRIIFRIFYYFMFGCLFFLVFALLLCVCVNGLHVFYLFTKFTFFYFFHIHANTDKDANCFQSNYNSSSKNLWLLFSVSFLFLNIQFNKSGNITLRLFLFLFVYFFIFLHKHIKTTDHQEAVRSCSRYEFFTSDFIDTCEDVQSLITQLTIDHYSFSKLKYQNLNSFFLCYQHFQGI